MIIKKLLKEINCLNYIGKEDIDIDSITYDSRKVKTGCIFAAITGFKIDGHDFIKDAVENGASAVICEYIPDSMIGKSNFILVNSSRKSMSEISNIIYNKPSEKIKIIGVTGTNGKTSITYLLKSIFEYNNNKTGVIGTMGALVYDKKIKLNNTTPESADIQKILSDMNQENIKYAFMEVSSHALELNRVDDVSIDVGIFTNLTRDHLNFHGSMDNYYEAKKKLFLKANMNNIINIDDKYGDKLYKELKLSNINAVSYSIDKDADYRAENLCTEVGGTSFNLIFKGNNRKVKIKTPGRFSVHNSLAAIAAAHNFGISIDDIIEALDNCEGVSGRFEVLKTELDCTIILDFAHTPDGLEKVMQTIKEFAKGRKIVLFGAGGERDVSRRSLMGEVAGKYCDTCVLTSDNPRFEDPYKICEEIAKGVELYHNNYKIIIEREKAIEYVIENYKSGDVILLAGKSTEPYQVIGSEKVPYDEKTIAKRIIRIKEKKIEL